MADILSLQISLLMPCCFIYSSKIASWCKIMHPSHSQKVEIAQIGLLSAKESYFIRFWSTQSDDGCLSGNIKALPVEPVQTLRHQTGCRAYSFVCVHVANKQTSQVDDSERVRFWGKQEGKSQAKPSHLFINVATAAVMMFIRMKS